MKLVPRSPLRPGDRSPPPKLLADARVALVFQREDAFAELETRLRGFGCQLSRHHAVGGLAFSLRKEAPELLLLDASLRDEGGLELCQLLAKDPSTRSLRILIAGGDPDEAYQAGAADVLEPELGEDALLHRLATQLRLSRYEAAIRRREANVASSQEVLSSFAAAMQDRARRGDEQLNIAQQARLDSERTTGSLLRAESWAAALLTPDGGLIETNETFQSGLGLSEDKLRGQRLQAQLPELAPLLVELRAERRRVSLEFEVRPGLWWDTSMEPVLDDNGNITRIVLLATDTSVQRHLLRQTAIQTSLLNHCDQAVAAVDHRGRVSYANPAFLRLLQRSDPPLGVDIFELLVGPTEAPGLRIELGRSERAKISLLTAAGPIRAKIHSPGIAEDDFIGRAFFINPKQPRLGG